MSTAIKKLMELRDQKKAFQYIGLGLAYIIKKEKQIIASVTGVEIPWNPQTRHGYVSYFARPAEEVFVERGDFDAAYFLPLFIEPPTVQKIVYPQSDFRSLFQAETLPYSELLDYL